MTGEQDRTYPKSQTVRRVSVDARDRDNWTEQFEVVTPLLETSIDGRQIGGLYERRWQGETFFRELKSRMQLGGYVLMKFEAVERYLDLLLLGFLLLEQQRLRDLKRAGPPSERCGEEWVQARTTDRLRSLEAVCDEWNAEAIERRMSTDRGRKRLLKELRERVPRVA